MTYSSVTLQHAVALQDGSNVGLTVYRAFKEGLAAKMRLVAGEPYEDTAASLAAAAASVAGTDEGFLYRMCVQEFINGFHARYAPLG